MPPEDEGDNEAQQDGIPSGADATENESHWEPDEPPDVPDSEEEDVNLQVIKPNLEARRKYVQPGGIVSVFKNADERRRSQDRANADDYIAYLRTKCTEMERVKLAAADQLAQIVGDISDTSQQIKVMEEKLGAGKTSAMEERQLAQMQRDLSKHNDSRMSFEKDLYAATHELALAEANLHKYDQMAEAIAQEQELEAEESYVLSGIMAAKATQLQENAWRRHQDAEKDEIARLQALAEAEDVAQKAAEKGQRGARERMSIANKHSKEVRDEVNLARKEEHMERATAVLDLKKSTEEAQNKIKASNLRRAKKEAKMELLDEKRRLEVVAAGGNPYAVKGLREEAERFEAHIEQNAQVRAARHAEIADRLIKEEEYLAKKDEEERQVQAYEERFQKELGRVQKEKRVADYIRARTKGGRDLIDPTSRKAHIYPSYETVVRTAKFGLGGAADDVMEKVQKDLHEDPMGTHVVVQEGHMHTTVKRFQDTEVVKPDDMHITVHKREPPPAKPEPVQRPISPDALPDQPHAKPELDGLWKVEEKKKQIQAGDLSVYEQRMMAEAHERHRTQLTKEQHVWGKVYKGPGFLCDPSPLRFIDFHVDTIYKRKVTVTNVSLSFNYFKLLELDDTVKNFFEANGFNSDFPVKFSPPGRMSAGLTCDVWITFEPKLNEDIFCEVPFLGETGPFALKLECTTRKVELYFNPEADLDLGEVEMDQSNTKVLTITNRGNLSTKYTIKPLASHSTCNGEEYDGFEEISFMPQGVIEACEVHRDKGGNVIDDYDTGRTPSTTRIPITFTPQRAGKLDVTLEIEFDDLATPPFVLRIVATGKLVPVYFEFPSMQARTDRCPTFDDELQDHRGEPLLRCDLETCLMTHFHRDLLQLRNRGGTALKCQAVVPKAMRKFVEFHPDMCYVQAFSDFPVQVKFTPDFDMVQKAIEGGYVVGQVLENDTCDIKIPVSILVPDRQPVNFVIVGRITPPTVKFSTTEVDFGSCPVAEAVRVPVTITNMSCLPQQVAFPELRVEPLDGFVSLLPYPDTFTFDLLFQPSAAMTYSFNASFKTLWNHETKIKCHGKGVSPPLLFSQPVIKFAAAPQAQLQTHYVFLENVTKKERQFEFGIPEDWPIRVYPSTGCIGPKSKLRLRLDFTSADAETANPPVSPGADPTDPGSRPPSRLPTNETLQSTQDDTMHATGADDGTRAGDAGDTGSAGDVGDGGDDDDLAAVSTPQHKPVKKDRWETFTMPCFIRDFAEKCIYLEMQTCVFHSNLVVECDGPDEFGGTSLVFGEVALGQAAVRKIRIWNHSDTTTDLDVATPMGHGPFRVLSGVTPVEAGSFLDVQVQFKPLEAERYAEDVVIYSKIANVTVTLRGDGVVPSLRLEPAYLEESPSDGSAVVFDVGDGLREETITRSISIINASDQFELVFHVHSKDNMHPNHTSVSPFDCVPNMRVIERSGRENVVVRFSPDHESWRWSQLITVEIPGQPPKPIELIARSWTRSLFLKGGDPPQDEVEDPFADEEAVADETKIVRVTFNHSDMSRELFVGNIAAADPSKKNDRGEVELAVPGDAAALGFTVEPTKVSLGAGDPAAPIRITFKPNLEDGTLLKGEWVETVVKCSLKGGYVPAGGAPVATVELVVKGMVT